MLLTVWARRAVVCSWRESALIAWTVGGCWVVVTTELLSSFHFICFLGIAGMWGASGFLASMALFLERRSLPGIGDFEISLSWKDIVSIVFLAIVVMATLVNALNSPPNTWDALTYHMSRVAHWVQDRSVEFYPTHIPRQLFSNPWLEYTILQFQILCQGDQWASAIQWFCMIGSLINVSLIARVMGLSTRSQWLSVLIAATVPIGIIESTSVQGDYAATFWLSAALAAFLNFKQNRRWLWVLICGISLGLACLSKGTAIVLSLPILLWIGGDVVKSFTWQKFVQAIVVLLMVLSVNALFIERNMGLYHQKVLGPVTDGSSLVNSAINYQTFTANLLRNIGIHLGTPSRKLNDLIENGIQNLAQAAHADLNDPRASFGNDKFQVGKPSRGEDSAPAPFHLGLFLIASILLFYRREYCRRFLPYFCCVLVMALMFFLVVRWQPWIIRFQLPLFVLFAPLCAAAFEGYWDNRQNIILITVLFIIASPYVFNASPRHLFGPKSLFHKSRIERYFLGNSPWSEPYNEAANEILKSGCQNVGLVLGGDSWEYPLWALLERDRPWNGRMEHVMVDNLTKDIPYPLGDFKPCQIVVIGMENLNSISWEAANFSLTDTFASGNHEVRIFSKV